MGVYVSLQHRQGSCVSVFVCLAVLLFCHGPMATGHFDQLFFVLSAVALNNTLGLFDFTVNAV